MTTFTTDDRKQAYDPGLGCVTPSGGLHWLYRVSNGELPGNTKLARKPGENGGVDVWAETRSEGGFTITAPSGGTTHPSGGNWTLIGGSIETIPTITMEQRSALHNIFAMFDEMPKAESIQQEVPVIHKGTQGYGYSFADLPTIFNVINPLLKKLYVLITSSSLMPPYLLIALLLSILHLCHNQILFLLCVSLPSLLR